MELGLSDDVAVVVGGCNGIGWAMAQHLAAERARVALLDVDSQVTTRADELAARFNVETAGWQVDVADYSAVRETRSAVVNRFGPCRHLMFAVGVGSGKYGFPFWDLEPGDWPRVLEVNLLGAVHVAHAFAEDLRRASPGSLLLLSSVAGQIGSQTDPPYSASKAALINFAQCAAKDFAPYQVRVNVICPGMVRTELNRSVYAAWRAKQPADCGIDYETWAEEKIRRVAPLGRWQTAEEVAALAVMLASQRSASITGQTLNVDGGQVM